MGSRGKQVEMQSLSARNSRYVHFQYLECVPFNRSSALQSCRNTSATSTQASYASTIFSAQNCTKAHMTSSYQKNIGLNIPPKELQCPTCRQSLLRLGPDPRFLWTTCLLSMCQIKQSNLDSCAMLARLYWRCCMEEHWKMEQCLNHTSRRRAEYASSPSTLPSTSTTFRYVS